MERIKNQNLKNFIITSSCGFAGCLITGFLFFQKDIFNLSANKSIITWLGLAGALVFSSMIFRNIKESLLFLVAVILLNIIIPKPHLISFIIRAIALYSSFWLSIYLYKTWFYNSPGKYNYLKAFGLGVITAILLFIAGLFLIFVNVPLERISIELIFQISFYYLQSGMLIGLGLGLGFEFAKNFFLKNKL
jgi:hypothetical protein